jgi:Membrane-associated lipoprotein involved in thiamine biosynthesis
MEKKFSRLLPIALAVASVAVLLGSCSHKVDYCVLSGYAQGGTYSVKFSMEGVKVKHSVIQQAVDSILTMIDTTLSGYNKASQLSRFNAGEDVRVNAMFKDVFARSRNFYSETGGALDVAAGPLFDAWGFGFKKDSLPSEQTVVELMNSCGMDKVAEDMTAVGDCPHPVLNFNAVAQGYTSDCIAEYLHSLGVHDMLVDIGEIYCEGVNAKGNCWKVGVDRPVDGNMTPGADIDGIWQGDGTGCGIVTSGNYRKFYEKDGRKYSHTIDPRSGYPVAHSLLSATIVAPTATQADAYATYCMVIGLDEAKKFISSRDDLEGYLIFDSEGGMKEWASEGFNLLKD